MRQLSIDILHPCSKDEAKTAMALFVWSYCIVRKTYETYQCSNICHRMHTYIEIYTNIKETTQITRRQGGHWLILSVLAGPASPPPPGVFLIPWLCLCMLGYRCIYLYIVVCCIYSNIFGYYFYIDFYIVMRLIYFYMSSYHLVYYYPPPCPWALLECF